MIKIDFQEPNSRDWINWKAQCQRAQLQHDEAIESGEKPEVKSKIYKGADFNIKFTVYFNRTSPFSGKCAFCESDVLANQPGDIEHYRPKAKVKDEDGKDIMVDIDGVNQPHPGYYWLAYDWSNFLPSCRDCNSRTKAKTKGKLIGKGNLFPVRNFRAVKAGEHINEEPMIINPIFIDPRDHLWIDNLGIIHGHTPEGKTSIEIFGLNRREGLITARKDTYDQVKDKMKVFISYLQNDSRNLEKLLEELDLIKKGKKPYSLAAIQAMEDVVTEQEELVNKLRSMTDN